MSAAGGALSGQVAIVTGAGRGIGHAIAMALAREAATVVLAARTRQELAAAATAIRESGGTALAIPTDVTQDAAVEAMMACCRAVLPAMIRQHRGTIINIASVAAQRPIPGAAVYTATKAGVVGFSRVLAEELRGDGVRVGVLVPGAVDTPLWDTIGNPPDRSRMLRPEDVARAAVLMASLPPGASLEELTLMPAGGIL